MRHNGSRPENRKFETTDKKVIKSKEILMEEDRVPVIGKGVRDQESPTECKCEQEEDIVPGDRRRSLRSKESIKSKCEQGGTQCDISFERRGRSTR
ncbi:hypothetical protein J6590_032466 [Homalodisca vitripennis]|nr:hypothetical protein J6590_032466 [Homalodisca vitripennis]